MNTSIASPCLMLHHLDSGWQWRKAQNIVFSKCEIKHRGSDKEPIGTTPPFRSKVSAYFLALGLEEGSKKTPGKGKWWCASSTTVPAQPFRTLSWNIPRSEHNVSVSHRKLHNHHRILDKLGCLTQMTLFLLFGLLATI